MLPLDKVLKYPIRLLGAVGAVGAVVAILVAIPSLASATIVNETAT